MKIQEIHSIAKDHGLKTGQSKKITLIHAIQRNESNIDCFTTASNQYCDQTNCLWREDCFNTSQQPSDHIIH